MDRWLRHNRIRRLIRAALMCLCALAVLGWVEYGGPPAPEQAELPVSARIANYDQVIASIRHGLRFHAHSITVRFRYREDILDALAETVGDWTEEALRETGEPTEGDYIRYQYDGYSIDCRYKAAEDGWLDYTVEITPRYYTYLTQEEEVTERLRVVYASFAFDGSTSDYEKIRTIYDYVCANVTYDRVHKRNEYHHMKSTAYAALIRRTATCQGYCVLLYRMLRENGIGCRVVTGTACGEDHEEFHAWNIVELDGVWYHLDATWDAGKGEWRYFLRGSASFDDHVPGARFRTEEFMGRYPAAESDYIAEPQGTTAADYRPFFPQRSA